MTRDLILKDEEVSSTTTESKEEEFKGPLNKDKDPKKFVQQAKTRIANYDMHISTKQVREQTKD